MGEKYPTISIVDSQIHNKFRTCSTSCMAKTPLDAILVYSAWILLFFFQAKVIKNHQSCCDVAHSRHKQERFIPKYLWLYSDTPAYPGAPLDVCAWWTRPTCPGQNPQASFPGRTTKLVKQANRRQWWYEQDPAHSVEKADCLCGSYE